MYYGGRGIKVCDRWKLFLNFLEDMGKAPTESHTIDRINSDGNYEPKNCRWLTMLEQTRNRRARSNTSWLTFHGETLSVTDWGKKLGIKRHTIYARIKSGWKTEDILTLSPHPGVSSGGWRKIR